jgi:hypothetical protein
MDAMTIVQYIVIGYLVLIFMKSCLVMATNGVAAAVFARKSGRSFWFYYSTICLTMPLVLAMRIPYLLYAERSSFFVVYEKRQVIREILEALNTYKSE